MEALNNIVPLPEKERKLTEFYKLYFDYTGLSSARTTEVPTIFNRWSPIACIGALLSRQCWLEHGHWIYYPNMYIMLVGEPAARKTTSITLGKKLLRGAGYTRFAADRTSKERFLKDLTPGEEIDNRSLEELIELPIDEPSDRFIVADEFLDFVGKHNLEFLTILAKLWDSPDEYRHPKITGASIVITKPTVSILAGSQPDMIYSVFPPEAIGQGIMSRFIMVFSQSTGIKIDFPDAPNTLTIKLLTDRLREIKTHVIGAITLSKSARLILGQMYNDAVGVDDFRFKHYNNRRFIHLLKLSMIFAAMDCRTVISVEDAINANTLLFATENRMPRALGEFGSSRNSVVANKVIQILAHYNAPVGIRMLFKQLANEVDNYNHLVETLEGMIQSEKIKSIHIDKKQGYVPNVGIKQEWKEGLINLNFLTTEEIG